MKSIAAVKTRKQTYASPGPLTLLLHLAALTAALRRYITVVVRRLLTH